MTERGDNQSDNNEPGRVRELVSPPSTSSAMPRRIELEIAPAGSTCASCGKRISDCAWWDTHARVYWCEHCWDFALDVMGAVLDDYDEELDYYRAPRDGCLLGPFFDKLVAIGWDAQRTELIQIWTDPASGITHQRWGAGTLACKDWLPFESRVDVTCLCCAAGTS